MTLRKHHNPQYKPPSSAWFYKWYKENGLHRIKTKPIAVVRFTAQQEKEVLDWFKVYHQYRQEYKIKGDRIDNFDEGGFRIGCPKGHDLLVPEEVREV